VGLQLEDEEQESRISFPVELNSIDYVVSVFGSLAYIGGILLLLYGTYTYFFTGAEGEETAFWLISIACVMAFFGAVCFSVRQRIVSLIRTPANLIVRYTYGAFWVRSIRFTKDTPISVRAKDQSITDYDTTQDVPYSEVTIKKISWMVSFRPVKFYVLANPSQVSWIKGGLMDWFASEENLSQNESST
jgi:hypothetical protein